MMHVFFALFIDFEFFFLTLTALKSVGFVSVCVDVPVLSCVSKRAEGKFPPLLLLLLTCFLSKGRRVAECCVGVSAFF